MSSQWSNSWKVLQIPNIYFIIWKSMTCDNFIFSFWKNYRTNLTTGLLLTNHFLFINIPKSYTSISSTSSGSNKIRLIRTPSQSLNSCFMSFLKYWNLRFWRINEEFIIISARCKIIQTWRPFQSTNLLSMTSVFSLTLSRRVSKIKKHNWLISWTSYKIISSQTYSTDSLHMSSNSIDYFIFFYISNFSLPIQLPNS